MKITRLPPVIVETRVLSPQEGTVGVVVEGVGVSVAGFSQIAAK